MTKSRSSWTLKSKLLISILIAGLLPLLIVGIVTIQYADSAIEDGIFSKLEGLREAKKSEITNYLQTIRDQVITLSASPMTVEAMQSFSRSFQDRAAVENLSNSELERYTRDLKGYYQNEFAAVYQRETNQKPDIDSIFPGDPNEIFRQYKYIAGNSNPLGSKDNLDTATVARDAYDRFHSEYHPFFRQYLHKFGYYDIFLVEPKTGNIVYSVFKELDYATSLKNGAYRNTNFAQAFKQALTLNQGDTAVLEDFKPYTPSYEAAASFIASPIYDGAELVGVLIFQMPIGRINDIMTASHGLGETGETILIGGDKLMRSQSRFSDQNTVGKQTIDSESVERALKGETGSGIIVNAQGDERVSFFAPINVLGLNWAILAEINTKESFAAETVFHAALAIIAIIAVLIVAGFTFFVVRSVQKQLGADPTDIQKITDSIASGDLSVQINNARGSAVGVLASLLKMRDNLRNSMETDQKLAAESARIKQALDVTSGNIMVADANNDIIYLNTAVQKMFAAAEADIKKDIPSFSAGKLLGANIDQFHKNPAHQQNMLNHLANRLDSKFVVGGRTMKFTANPVFDEQKNRLGTVVEWTDQTAEVAIQQEVENLISAARNGDLTQTIELEGKKDFFLEVSQGINELVQTVAAVFEDVAQVMGALSHGDLEKNMSGDYSGTYAEVKENVNATISSLLEIVTNIRSSTNLITSASQEISSGNNSLSQRTEQQAASLEETASSMEELTSTVRQNADNAQHANQLSTNARETAQNGSEIVNNAITAMEEINQASSQISEIVGVIDEIAFQTNLLALNASVEAARAGEQGRGFAVVATEVRNLAQRSATSAKEIKELILDTVRKVESGTGLVNQSGEALENIMTSVVKVGDIVAEISTASQEQADGINQINQTITNLDDLTQQNAALAEQTSAASAQMNEHALNMSKQVEFFSTGEAASSGNSPALSRPASTVTQLASAKPAAAPPASTAKPVARGTPAAAPQAAKAFEPEFDSDEWEEF